MADKNQKPAPKPQPQMSKWERMGGKPVPAGPTRNAIEYDMRQNPSKYRGR